MAEFRIILVEPEYPVNLGHCARVLANFGYRNMHVVKPKTRVGKTAVMYSKHGRKLLEGAERYKSIKEATSDCDFIVGTTGVLKRGRRLVRNPLSLEQFAKRARRSKKRFAVLFGREGTGLVAEEVKLCDFLVTIPTSRDYPTLNLSHALAIVLYAISEGRRHKLIRNAKRNEKEHLVETFSDITEHFRPHLRNPDKINAAFRRVVGRSLISELEASALLCVMKKAKEEVKRKTKAS